MASSLLSDLASWAQIKGSGPRVRFTLPPRSYFRFPPNPDPLVLPPPPNNPTLAHPFTIPTEIYNGLLSPTVPLTVALVYITTVTLLNQANARRNYKPWAISKTAIFSLGVLLHNLLLAVYSGWTFVGMINAVRLTDAHWSNEGGFAGAIDALCKIHGPRGFGSAATFSESTSQWGIANTAYHLSSEFLPENTDVGRIWNEGLAFYGWIFYLSKFYEVIDTLIIIAKGKKSSFLQTYHHAGAMLCVWAGIRYMSPPIWMFVTINSFIHTVMYTFYFCTALRIKIPKPLKQSLTTMQITQMVFGASYAFLHYFIEYQIPVKTPYVFHLGQKIVEGASALGADAASEFTSAMAAVSASADSAAWLKKLALRAAGREGLAENVLNNQGQTFGIDAVHAVTDFVRREEIRYHDELKWVPCLDTSGQSFAIYINLLYLLPLTWLFLRFFVNSYLRRTETRRRSSLTDRVSLAGQSLGDAKRKVSRRLSEALENSQGWNGDLDRDPVVIDGDKVRAELRKLDETMKKKADEAASEIPSVEETKQIMKEASQKIEQKASQTATSTSETAEKVQEQISQMVQSGEQSIKDIDIDDVLKKAWATVDSKGRTIASSGSQQTSSSSHQTFSSSSKSEVSSTTVFESSSISKSAQDEVIGSSQLVRDEDVNTKTAQIKKEGSHIIASNNSSKMLSSTARTVVPTQVPRATIVKILTDQVRSPQLDSNGLSATSGSNMQTSNMSSRPSPSATLSSVSNSSVLSFPDQDSIDGFSQTRPAISSSLNSVSIDPENLPNRPHAAQNSASLNNTSRISASMPPPTQPLPSLIPQLRSRNRDRSRDTKNGKKSDESEPRSSSTRRSVSPAKPRSSMIPAPIRKTSPPGRTNPGSVSPHDTVLVHPRMSTSTVTSTLTSTPVSTSVSAMPEKQVGTSASPTTPSPQSRKWHARRRGHADGGSVSTNTSPSPSHSSFGGNDAHPAIESDHYNHDHNSSSASSMKGSLKSSQELAKHDVDVVDDEITRSIREPRRLFNEKRDEIDDVTSKKGDDDSVLF